MDKEEDDISGSAASNVELFLLTVHRESENVIGGQCSISEVLFKEA